MVRNGRKITVIAWILAIVCLFSGCTFFVPSNMETETAVPTTAITSTPGEETFVPGETEGVPSASYTDAAATPTPSWTPILIPTLEPTDAPTVSTAGTPTVLPTQTAAPTQTASPTQKPTATPVKTAAPTPTQGTVTVTQAPAYCRTVLNSSMRAAYDTIVEALSNPQAIQADNKMGNGIKVTVQYRQQSNLEQEVALLVETIIMDHPELFYILNQYVYTYSGTKLTSITIQTLSKSEALALQTSVENGIQSYMNQVSGNQDQYEISKQLYELLATNILYSQEKGNRAHSVVGAFVDGQGVCETYAKAYQLLLNRYGIRAFTVSGTGRSEAHRWIAMEINGHWYYSDPTWGDLKTYGDVNTYPKEGYLKVNYSYLHLTAAQMGTDHTLDEISVQITQGLSFTSTADNYFVKENGYFATMDYAGAETYIKAQFVKAQANKNETFGIRLGDAATYNAMKEYIHNNLYRLYRSAVPGGTASLSYYLNPDQCVLHIYMR